MKKTDITNGIAYLEVPEVDLRILCGCPENSIKFIMQAGLTPSVKVNGFNLVSGPNSILLNDYSILNSHFLNFAEFPVLHHQYFQGAAFNGTNEKFNLIGNEDKVINQYEYIRRGLHGLVSKEEILDSGVEESIADKFIAISDYHRGQDKNFDILNNIYIEGKTKIKGDLYIQRLSINVFEFTYLDERITIDINLKDISKGVGLPYNIDHKLIEFDDFSITTVGDGNGWNPDVPCMGAMISAKGSRYLVDSGPGSFDLIRNLGVSPSEVDGVFVTHSHDDHFTGLLSLLNSDSKIKFFSSAIVIASVEKKFEALLHMSKGELKKYIDFIVLREGVWTDIGEMEVNPKYSFHTIETNVFYFRSKNSQDEWKVYGHITDIISKKDLNYMLDNDKSGCINHEWANRWFNNYLDTVDLKRVDAGGGVVHGNSHDFVDDKSSKIILSHLNSNIDISENPNFCAPTDFGHTEVLIKSDNRHLLKKAESILSELNFCNHLSNIKMYDKDISISKPNDLIFKKGDKVKYIYLVLSGVVESTDKNNYVRKYVKGDFLYSFNNEKNHHFDYRSNSYCYLYKINIKQMNAFIKRIKPDNTFRFLRNCSYFHYGFSLEKLIHLSKLVKQSKVKKDKIVSLENYDSFIVYEGAINYNINSILVRSFKEGEMSVWKPEDKDSFKAEENSIILLFRQEDITSFTSLLWSCFEESKKIETIVETGII